MRRLEVRCCAFQEFFEGPMPTWSSPDYRIEPPNHLKFADFRTLQTCTNTFHLSITLLIVTRKRAMSSHPMKVSITVKIS